MELIGKNKFAAAAFDPEDKAFVVYVAALSVNLGDKVHASKKAQIAYLKVDQALTKVFGKYIDFVDVFSSKLATKLPKHTGINDHAIELVDNWQPQYGSIYSLSLVELETLKVYIKNNLVNGFVRFSKSLAKALIFFNKKPNGSLRLYIDYQDLNNLTIKNWYSLPLVRESLD